MKRLWIADVHANLPAFEAVIRDAGDVDEVLFLGDIIGCGPHPSACVNLLRTLRPKTILGNHDTSILSVTANHHTVKNEQLVLNWDEWTFGQLGESQLMYLRALPDELTIVSAGREIRVIHHPPGAPYLHPLMPDTVLAGCFQNVPGSTVFCGHSHRLIDRLIEGRRYVCIPAVGQARNGDIRAGYGLEIDGELLFRFVAYDVQKVIADVRKIGFPEKFCERWVRFISTGFDSEWSRDYMPDSCGTSPCRRPR